MSQTAAIFHVSSSMTHRFARVRARGGCARAPTEVEPEFGHRSIERVLHRGHPGGAPTLAHNPSQCGEKLGSADPEIGCVKLESEDAGKALGALSAAALACGARRGRWWALPKGVRPTGVPSWGGGHHVTGSATSLCGPSSGVCRSPAALLQTERVYFTVPLSRCTGTDEEPGSTLETWTSTMGGERRLARAWKGR